MRVYLARDLLQANQQGAGENRRLLEQNNMFMVNVIGSPGSGKTTLLEATLKALPATRAAVIEGDLYTSEDAEKLAPWCEKVLQINTEGACHLEAGHIGQLIVRENLLSADLLLVENIGNLVCPAEFDLGEDLRVVLVSVAEGNDKPRKYPMAFKNASAAVITKTDLLPHCNFSMDTALADLRRINPHLTVFAVSTKSGEGLERWRQWLEDRLQTKIKSASN